MKLSMFTKSMLALVLAACSSSPDGVPQPPVPPTKAARYVVPTDNRQTYEPSTQQFLQQEIDRKSAPPSAPQEQPQRQQQPEQAGTVERTVYVERPQSLGYPYDYNRPPQRAFPWHTAWGAGIGAIIGNQHHHQAAEGAWIGAGVGMLMDIASWRGH